MSNAINVDGLLGSAASVASFTNGGSPDNDINLGTATTNTFVGLVFAFNNSGVAGTNDITLSQGVFNRNLSLSNGLHAAPGVAVNNTVTMATAGTGVDVTGKVVISNANTSGAGANVVNINIATVAGAATVINGVTRIDTGAGSDTVTITAPGSGTAVFNDSVFIALGAGDDILNIGASAASPAFSTADKFQFDGGKGKDGITASPASLAHYQLPLPGKLRAKITGFEPST